MARNINPILVNVKLTIDLHNMVVVLQVGCKLIKQESGTFEKHRLLERIIPKNGFQFPFRQRIRKNIPVDQADGFTGFFLCEILALKGQNVIEQALVPSIPGFHIQKLHIGFHRGQPFGKFLNFIFWAILKHGAIHTLEAHNGIAVIAPHLGICFNAKGQGLFCPAFFNIPFRVFEIKVFAPCGGIHPALQGQILNDLEQKIRSFTIININQDRFFSKNGRIFIKVLNIFKGVQPFPPLEFFKALLVLCRHIAPEQLHWSNPPPQPV